MRTEANTSIKRYLISTDGEEYFADEYIWMFGPECSDGYFVPTEVIRMPYLKVLGFIVGRNTTCENCIFDRKSFDGYLNLDENEIKVFWEGFNMGQVENLTGIK
ncbi:MAG TPA: hypothetical protein VG895_02795 [Patescibacteria group bacterium]|nr:hypothetical protein [Patescibacteria group bacterium]